MHRRMLGSLRAFPVAGLLAAGLAVSPAAPVAAQPSGTWTRTGTMTTPRLYQTATVLQNGQVLVAGGQGAMANGSYPTLSSAELYDPATGTWTATGSMTTSELYHPATGTWALTGSMTTARTDHTATPLPNGQVLAAGGETQNNRGEFSVTASAELYTP